MDTKVNQVKVSMTLNEPALKQWLSELPPMSIDEIREALDANARRFIECRVVKAPVFKVDPVASEL